MTNKTKKKTFWAGVPPWIFIGAVVVLFPIFAFMITENLNRQRENNVRLLLEKGAALIRSFEAGTRTGMMGRMRSGFKLQRLLTETAQLPDIVHLLVADTNGVILAHSDLSQIGKTYGNDLDLTKISGISLEQWRFKSYPDGKNIFEVFRRFSPTGGPMGKQHGRRFSPTGGSMGKQHGLMIFHPKAKDHMHMQPDVLFDPQIIFVGLDMETIVVAQKADARHTVVMGIILLLTGFAGIIFLFLTHSYRTTKASLSRVKAFSDNLVENVPTGLIAVDDKQKIVSFNHVAETVLGISIEEAIQKKAKEILPIKLLNQIDHPDIKKGIVEKEIDCLVQDGSSIPLQVSATLLHDEDQTFLGHVLLFKDLSEVQALRREIARNQRLASIGRLAAGVAHEIRNPLSSIKGFATYFKERYRENKDDQQTANIMIQEVERLNRVVGQLLEFARPVTISKKLTSIDVVINNSLKLIESDSLKKNIKVETNFPSSMNEVLIDPDRINQVLLNLCLNAIEAMENGGRLTVALLLDEENKWIKISVKDTGTGIKKEELAHIFDPYFTTKPSGTGLGLAIVHNIIDAHDGKMKVESSLQKGTTVTLFLPISNKDKNR
ncbi:MAG: PAS domain S-box protein [Deltaproteobacteria bacterium]|nr:PAS domain S-box protein [Deltaproteobacteria bacterium]